MSKRLTDEQLREQIRFSPDEYEVEAATEILALRVRVAKLEALLTETLRIYGRWLDGTFRERVEEAVGVAPPKPDNDGPQANLRTPWVAPQ